MRAQTKCQYWILRVLRTIIWRLLKLCYSESVCGFCGLLWILLRWITVNFCTAYIQFVYSIFSTAIQNFHLSCLPRSICYFENSAANEEIIFTWKNCHLHQLLMKSYVSQCTSSCRRNDSLVLAFVPFLNFTLSCVLSFIIFSFFCHLIFGPNATEWLLNWRKEMLSAYIYFDVFQVIVTNLIICTVKPIRNALVSLLFTLMSVRFWMYDWALNWFYQFDFW